MPPAVSLRLVRLVRPPSLRCTTWCGSQAGRGLVAAAGVLARLVPQGDQAPQVDRYVVGLPDVEREGGAVEAFAGQVAAQEGGHAAGAGQDLQDLGDDLVLQAGQHLSDRGGLPGLLGLTGGAADQTGRNDRAAVRDDRAAFCIVLGARPVVSTRGVLGAAAAGDVRGAGGGGAWVRRLW